MNRPSNSRHSWSWLPVAFSCCGLLFVGEAARRADAQEKPNFGPFEKRESRRIIPNDATSIRRVPLTLIGQVETPAAEQVPAAGRTPDAAAPPAKPNSAPEFLPRLSPVEQKILDALSETTEVAFVDSPLNEALEVLKDLHSIQIWIDKETLSAEGIATDTPVNLQLSGISLQSALRLILEPLALTYVIEDEVLKITTQKAADKTIVTRTYPVGDLFATREEAEELVESLVCGLGLSQKGKEGPRSLAVSVPSGAIIARLSRPQNDELLQLLRDLREAKLLVPKRPVAEFDAPRSRIPSGDATRRPTLSDEFSPGLVPDDSQKRRRVPEAKPDNLSSPPEVPAPPKPKAVR